MPVYTEESEAIESTPKPRQPTQRVSDRIKRKRAWKHAHALKQNRRTTQSSRSGSAATTPDLNLEPMPHDNMLQRIDSNTYHWQLSLLGEISTAAMCQHGSGAEQIGNLAADLYLEATKNTVPQSSATQEYREALYHSLSTSHDIPWVRFSSLHIRM